MGDGVMILVSDNAAKAVIDNSVNADFVGGGTAEDAGHANLSRRPQSSKSTIPTLDLFAQMLSCA
jgi:hypothetical protein